MNRQTIEIAPQIEAHLGRDALAEALDSLTAVDCQTCDTRLTGKLALLVDDVGPLGAYASLHHRRCRRSEWNESGALSGGGSVTYQARSALLPGERDDGTPDPRALVVSNPTLERVWLTRPAGGIWRVVVPAFVEAAGMVPPGAELIIDQPITGAVARLTTHDSIAITLETGPHLTYEAPAELPEILAAARQHGGVLVAFTHAIAPADVSQLHELEPIFRGDRSVLGWVELESSRAARPKPAPALTGTTFVLHWSPQQMSVGPLLAHTTDPLALAAAQQWAADIATDHGVDQLTSWQLIARDQNAGWIAIDPVSTQFYELRRYPDGWRLIHALATVAGDSFAETENEARAWAAPWIQRHQPNTKLDWRPGPTPSADVVALYIDA